MFSCRNQKPSDNTNIEVNKIESLLNLFRTPSKDYILIGAHRGDWRNSPENSLQAIRNCIKMGIDLVEIDVRKTKDGELVVFHDETLDRMTDSSGEVKDFLLDSLVKIPLLNGIGQETKFTIPTLKEALEEAKGKILVKLDKCYDHIPQAYSIVKDLEMQNQVIFITTKTYSDSKKDYGTTIDEILLMPAFNCTSLEDVPSFVQGHIDNNDPVAFEIGFDSEDCPSINAFDQIKENQHAICVDVLWASLCAGHDDNLAVEDPEGSWGWVIERGANILITDRPRDLLEYLKSKNLHN